MCGQCILDFLPFQAVKKSTRWSKIDHMFFCFFFLCLIHLIGLLLGDTTYLECGMFRIYIRIQNLLGINLPDYHPSFSLLRADSGVWGCYIYCRSEWVTRALGYMVKSLLGCTVPGCFPLPCNFWDEWVIGGNRI